VDVSDRPTLRAALDRISAELGSRPDASLVDQYLCTGWDERTLYDKLADAEPQDIPTLWKYMLVAEGHLRQPDVNLRYEICRAARVVPMLRALDFALTDLRSVRTTGLEDRLGLLASEKRDDAFDATVYEILVAAGYSRLPPVRELEFIPTSNAPTPDIRASGGATDLFAECKRFDRMSEEATGLRNHVRRLISPAFAMLANENISALVDVAFGVDPVEVDGADIVEAIRDAVRTGAAIIQQGFTIAVVRLPRYVSSDFVLYPSAKYYWERYGYQDGGQWKGLITVMHARFAGPSFIEDVDWDAAVRWRVTDQEVLWKHRRLGYSRLFKGVRQLAATVGDHTALHVLFERDGAVGHRREEMLHFLETMSDGAKAGRSPLCAWIVFNELDIKVSLQGRYDFQENAYEVSWRRDSAAPPVTTVFVPPGNVTSHDGTWSEGPQLPPIDSET
jgi:hypothetical protein